MPKVIFSTGLFRSLSAILCLLGSSLASADFDAEALQENDDGSIRVVHPYFQTPDLTNYRINSDQSDLNGLCLAFGYQRYVLHITSAVKGSNLVSVTRHGTSGTLQQKVKDTTSVVEELVCRISTSSMISRRSSRADFTTNEDSEKSVAVVNPRFGWISLNHKVEGQQSLISADSHLDGVCRLFGFERAIYSTMQQESAKNTGLPSVVQIGRAGFVESISVAKGAVLSRVHCVKEVLLPISGRFDPAFFETTLQELQQGLYPIHSDWIQKVKTIAAEMGSVIRTSGIRFEKNDAFYARLQLLFLIKPFLESLDSNWAQAKIQPILNQQLEDLAVKFQVRGLSDIPKTAEQLKVCLRFLAATLKVQIRNSENPIEIQVLTKIQSLTGSALAEIELDSSASGAKNSLTTLLTKLSSLNQTQNGMNSSWHISGIVASRNASIAFLKSFLEEGMHEAK